MSNYYASELLCNSEQFDTEWFIVLSINMLTRQKIYSVGYKNESAGNVTDSCAEFWLKTEVNLWVGTELKCVGPN